MLFGYVPVVKAATVDEVIERIKNLKFETMEEDTYTEVGEALKGVVKDYNALSAEDRAQVTNLQRLKDTRNRYFDYAYVTEIETKAANLSNVSRVENMASLKSGVDSFYDFDSSYVKITEWGRATIEKISSKKSDYDNLIFYYKQLYYDGELFNNTDSEIRKFLRNYSGDEKGNILLKLVVDVGLSDKNHVDSMGFYLKDRGPSEVQKTLVEEASTKVLMDYYFVGDPTISDLLAEIKKLQDDYDYTQAGTFTNLVEKYFPSYVQTDIANRIGEVNAEPNNVELSKAFHNSFVGDWEPKIIECLTEYTTLEYRALNTKAVRDRKAVIDNILKGCLELTFKNRDADYEEEKQRIINAYNNANLSDPISIQGLVTNINDLKGQDKGIFVFSYLGELYAKIMELLNTVNGENKANEFVNQVEYYKFNTITTKDVVETDRSDIRDLLGKYKTDIPYTMGTNTGKKNPKVQSYVGKLQELLNALDRLRLDAWNFKINNANVLKLEKDFVILDDYSDIINSVANYEALDERVKGLDILTQDKARLDELFSVIADKFYLDNPVASKDTTTVNESDYEKIKKALQDYKAITDAKIKEAVENDTKFQTFKENVVKMLKVFTDGIENQKSSNNIPLALYDKENKNIDINESGLADKLVQAKKDYGAYNSKAWEIHDLGKTAGFITDELPPYKANLDALEIALNTAETVAATADEYKKKHATIIKYVDNPDSTPIWEDEDRKDPEKDDNYAAIEAAIKDFTSLSPAEKEKLIETPNSVTEGALNRIKAELEKKMEAEKTKITNGMEDIEGKLSTHKDKDTIATELGASMTEVVEKTFNDLPPSMKKVLNDKDNLEEKIKALRSAVDNELKPLILFETSDNVKKAKESTTEALIIANAEVINTVRADLEKLQSETIKHPILKARLEKITGDLKTVFDEIARISQDKFREFEQKHARVISSYFTPTMDDFDAITEAMKDLKEVMAYPLSPQDKVKGDGYNNKLQGHLDKLDVQLETEANAYVNKHTPAVDMKVEKLPSSMPESQAKEIYENLLRMVDNALTDYSNLEEESKRILWKSKVIGKIEEKFKDRISPDTLYKHLNDKKQMLINYMDGNFDYEDKTPEELKTATQWIPDRVYVPYDYEWTVKFNKELLNLESNIGKIKVFSYNSDENVWNELTTISTRLDSMKVLKVKNIHPYIKGLRYFLLIPQGMEARDGSKTQRDLMMMFRIE